MHSHVTNKKYMTRWKYQLSVFVSSIVQTDIYFCFHYQMIREICLCQDFRHLFFLYIITASLALCFELMIPNCPFSCIHLLDLFLDIVKGKIPSCFQKTSRKKLLLFGLTQKQERPSADEYCNSIPFCMM